MIKIVSKGPSVIGRLLALKGLRVKDLATQANVSRSYLSLVIGGKRCPSPPVAHAIAGALQEPLEALFDVEVVDKRKGA